MNIAEIAQELKPFEYTHSDKVDPPEPWQLEDIEQMYNECIFRGYTANWSEMGAKKTSTGLWLIQRLAAEFWENETIIDGKKVPLHPNCWACSTRSGKGTFFKLAPEILQGWYIFNITSQGIFLIVDGEEKRIKLDKIPDYFDMPTLVVTHFHLFSRANKGRFMEIDGVPIVDPKTKGIKMMPWTLADHFTDRKWNLCWLDEAHRVKSKDTKWTVVIKRSKDSIRMDTTGTGFINKPDEVWSLGDHMTKSVDAKVKDKLSPGLDPVKAEFIKGFWDFRDEFCLIDDDDGFEKVVGIKPERKDDFRAMVRQMGPRRTLSEVMPHLKEPMFVPIDVDLNPVQRKMYDSIKVELQAMDQKGKHINVANVLSMLGRLRAVCVATPEVVEEYYDEETDRVRQKIKLVEPSSKLDAVMELLDGLEWDEDRKDPVVIFSNFVGPLLLLEERFRRANEAAMSMGFEPEYPFLWMKEKHDDAERFNMWNDLFPSLQYRVFMSTLQLGGESISLTAARHLIFLDRSWSPKDNAQGIGRIRRPGQEGQPIVININARNTIDSYIEGVNFTKQGWFNEIFGDE